jgi:putative DNA primase/helicase
MKEFEEQFENVTSGVEADQWPNLHTENEDWQQYRDRKTRENRGQVQQAADEKLLAELLLHYEAAICTSAALQTKELKSRKKIMGEWLREGDLGFVYGERGSGKSWLVDAIAAHISSGRDLDTWKNHGAFPVLYVDGEMPADLTRERLVGMAKDNHNLYILHHELLFDCAELSMNLTDPLTQKVITKVCLSRKIKVLILDNLSCLFGSLRENESDDWAPILPWLLEFRRRRIAVIIVHHAGRSGFMRGSSKREDPASWMIKVAQANHGDHQDLGARFETSFEKPTRNSQIPEWNRTWHFKTEEDGTVSIGCEEINFDGKVLQVIQAGLRSAAEIAQELSVNKSTVCRAAQRLIDKKLISRRGRGNRVTYEPRNFMTTRGD